MKKLISGALAVLTAVIMALFPITAKAAVSGVWPVEPKFKTITTYFDPNRNVSDASGYHNAIDIQADGGLSGTQTFRCIPSTLTAQRLSARQGTRSLPDRSSDLWA